jgi:hypothetical protein
VGLHTPSLSASGAGSKHVDNSFSLRSHLGHDLMDRSSIVVYKTCGHKFENLSLLGGAGSKLPDNYISFL